jgi:YHS domain-containing protein
MKKIIIITGIALAASLGLRAEDAKTTTTPTTPDKLATCPVSGEKLGEMGDALTFTYQNQEVKLCCKSCKKKFDKDPEKFIKLIRTADAADKK